MPTEPEYLSAKQLAERLGVHPQVIYGLARSKSVPHLRIRGCLRFVLTDVVAALTVAPETPAANAGGQP